MSNYTESNPASMITTLLSELRKLTGEEDPQKLLVMALMEYRNRKLMAERALEDVILGAALSVQPANLDQILYALHGDEIIAHPKSEKIRITKHLRTLGWTCKQVRPSRQRLWFPSPPAPPLPYEPYFAHEE